MIYIKKTNNIILILIALSILINHNIHHAAAEEINNKIIPSIETNNIPPKKTEETLEKTTSPSYSIIPYFGIHYTKYKDNGFEGAEDIKLWKNKPNVIFGMDFYKNHSIVDFGVGFDISTQSITDTGSIIDIILQNNKKIQTQTFPIISMYATIKKDFNIYNKTFYVSSKAGFVMNYYIVQPLSQRIASGQIINRPGESFDICNSLFNSQVLISTCQNSLSGTPGGILDNGVINLPDAVYPNGDITAKLNNSLDIQGSYIFGLNFGYVTDTNVDISLYYNYKSFNMIGQAELILPINNYINLNVKDGARGSAIAKELGIKLGYRF